MTQNIIVYIIITLAVIYTIYRSYKIFNHIQNNNICDSGCISYTVKNKIARLMKEKKA
jgi:hypothetical protein